MNRSTGGSLKPPTALTDFPPARFGLQRAQVADEIAHLLLAEQEALDVLRLALERRLVDVDDREARVREPLRDSRDRVPLREADADDQVEALPGEGRHVGDVVRCRLRLDHATRDAELALGALQPLERELVEAVVVQLARVGDEPDLQRRGGGRVGGRRLAGGLVAPAAARGERPGCDRDGRGGEKSGIGRLMLVAPDFR